ncbi:HypC/HybG/HupF family hydrogenase formation chaperone [Rhodobacter ferrooxidans]|uniref:Hydrogenase assembly chaperone hypC/hupF n=1 Tax=Rhodobacter ferrooxidans TaxID=371731 RepID=C8S1A9_9RHOB|nr:HypC/HybG/HupF family hydrogenase formation chaperone [Rhodobacter sp. SW2]EEW25307.1 hydrogenase assembly chaperone hypC/hupF [Rhodobacter sp. SW2]
MCLAAPMKVTRIDGVMALCEARGVSRQASLFLMQHEGIAAGDHVLVQSGHVTAKVSEAEAAATWALYDEIFQAEAAAQHRLAAVKPA